MFVLNNINKVRYLFFFFFNNSLYVHDFFRYFFKLRVTVHGVIQPYCIRRYSLHFLSDSSLFFAFIITRWFFFFVLYEIRNNQTNLKRNDAWYKMGKISISTSVERKKKTYDRSGITRNPFKRSRGRILSIGAI